MKRISSFWERQRLESTTIKNYKGNFFNHSCGILVFLFVGRLFPILWSNISDCDETYNYWEPTHYLLYGYGFQTWEYSPLYAIRSYAYIWIHAIIGYVFNIFINDKIQVFYLIRSFLGLICTICEYYFYRGVCYQFGYAFGHLVLMFLMFGAGMFISSAAYLPSSFSMYMTMISYGALFSRHYKVSIVATAVSTIIAWPFSAILGVPIAYDILLRRRKIMFFLKWCIISLIIIMGPVVLIDTYYYGHLVISPLNIVLYNVFSKHGSHLYGIEPWTYYFINGILNFNILFCAALLSGPLTLWHWMKAETAEKGEFSKFWNSISGMYLWIAIFFSQPHKEERFLFPIYPLICVNGTLALHIFQKVIISSFKKTFQNWWKWISIVVMVYVILSISRILALHKGYSGPIQVFTHFKNISECNFEQNKIQVICVGKEWHRFPSNFFLPARFRIYFIHSDFHGQLPKPFSSLPNATQIIPDGMNDQNIEDGNQYIGIKDCQYLVDSDFPVESLLEPRYSQHTDKWKIILSKHFLDAKRSPKLLRAFYIPFLSEKYCTFVSYNILQRI